jgi:hypothetical protein
MLSDPELFINFHDAVDPCALDEDNVYGYYRKDIRPPFAVLSKYGDAVLKVICQNVIYEYFGKSNGKAINLILDHVQSNTTWRHFAIAYKMDQYLMGKPRNKLDDKFWGDMWEAYWGALFLERRLWNDHEVDLVSCLRVLLYFRTSPLFPDFGVYPFFTSERAQNLPLVISNDDIETVVVGPDHPSLPLSNKAKENVGDLGYRAKIKSTSRHYVDISIFSQIEDDAISKLSLYCSAPWSTYTLPSPSPTDKSLIFHRKAALPCMSTVG